MESINVLLTGTGAPGAPSIIRCLRKNGERNIKIIGVDMNSSAASRRLVDVFHVVPPAREKGFIDTILDICEHEHVQVVIPLVTRELELFSEGRELFEGNDIKVSVMPLEQLVISNNKGLLLGKMKELGMETPQFIIANDVDHVEDACRRIGYPQEPVCVKATRGNGSRGVRIIDEKKDHYSLLFDEKPNSMYMSYHDLILALRERNTIPEMMVMEYLPGEEYGIDALCDNGDLIYIAGRYNSTVSSSIPQSCVIEGREEPLLIAKKLIKELKLDGNINFDFMYDKNGKPRLIEINPRLSATITAYAPAGINFPYYRIKQLLGEKMPDVKIKCGISMQRRYSEVFFSPDGYEIEW